MSGPRHELSLRIRTLTRCSRTVAGIVDRDDLLRYSAAAAVALSNAAEAHIYLSSGDVTLRVRHVAEGESASIEELREPLASLVNLDPSAPMAAAPIVSNGITIGAIVVRGAAPADAEARWCLASFADHVAAALEYGAVVQRESDVLQRQSAEALREGERRREMLSAVAHEGRSPLMVLEIACDSLGETLTDPTAEQRDLLMQVRAARQRLQLLVENLVELRRMELGLLAMRPKNVAARSVIEAAAAVVAPGYSLKRQRLVIECDPALRVAADGSRLRHILQNLLANASKFGPADAEIKIRARRREDGIVSIDVVGPGPVIDSDLHEWIFRPYKGIPSPWSSTHVGIGLTVARELARCMGGDITVASKPGIPTRFTLELPR